MTQHNTRIDYPGGFHQLAKDLTHLRYDALADFLHEFGECLQNDSDADQARGRLQLANALHEARVSISLAWRICRMHMDIPKET